MPELEDEAPAREEELEEDAADADKRAERLAQERREAERQKQSQPVKRGLPRPIVPQAMTFSPSFLSGGSQSSSSTAGVGGLLQQAEDLLHEEMAALINHDAFVHPTKQTKPPKKPVELQDFRPDDLARAEELLSAELSEFEALAGDEQMDSASLQPVFEASLGQASLGHLGHFVYVPQAKRYAEWRTVEKGDRLEAAKHAFELAEAQAQKDGKRAKKLEDKLNLVLGGYMGKVKQSISKLGTLSEECETAGVEADVFRTLRAREEKAIASRADELRELVDREKARNAKLQTRYKELKLLERKIDDKLQ